MFCFLTALLDESPVLLRLHQPNQQPADFSLHENDEVLTSMLMGSFLVHKKMALQRSPQQLQKLWTHSNVQLVKMFM